MKWSLRLQDEKLKLQDNRNYYRNVRQLFKWVTKTKKTQEIDSIHCGENIYLLVSAPNSRFCSKTPVSLIFQGTVGMSDYFSAGNCDWFNGRRISHWTLCIASDPSHCWSTTSWQFWFGVWFGGPQNIGITQIYNIDLTNKNWIIKQTNKPKQNKKTKNCWK